MSQQIATKLREARTTIRGLRSRIDMLERERADLAEKIKRNGDWQHARGDRNIVIDIVLTRKEYESAIAPLEVLAARNEP